MSTPVGDTPTTTASLPKPPDNSVPRGRNEELLGTERIGPLLARMSLPAMFAMFVMALYNVVDTIFLGRGVGPLAIGGLTVAFPFQIFTMALAMLLGTGAASVISRALGAGERERAATTAGSALSMAALLGIGLSVFAFLFTTPVLQLFGASEQLLPYAREYLTTILFGTPFIVLAMAGNNIIRAEGNARVSMMVMLVGAVINIILDPIFIFGFGMGIRGAALATVIGQFLSLMVTFTYFAGARSGLKLRLHHLIPRLEVLRSVLVLGLPAFIRQLGGSVLTILVNNAALIHGGEMAIASFGAINRVLVFALMPIFGLAQGFQPIAGYNFGAGKMARVRQTTRMSAIVATLVTGFFLVIMIAFPRTLVSAFTNDVEMLAIAIPAMRTIVFVLPLVGLQVIGATFFLAVGQAGPSLFLGMLRQIILLIPLVAILPRFLGLRGLWIAFPIADTLAAVITMGWLLSFLGRKLDKNNVATAD